MNDVGINLALIGRLVRRRWPVLLVLALLGAGLGAAASLVLSPGFVSTSKVLLQGSRDEKQLPAETQVATSLIVLDRTADALKWGVTGSQLQSKVSAIVSGNVIEISGAADTPVRAQQLADRATAQYIAFSTRIVTDAANASAEFAQKGRQAVQQHVDDANKRITELQASPAIAAPGPEGDQARTELQQQQQAITKASKDLEQVDQASESAALDASLGASSSTIIELATRPDAPASPTLIECIIGGALALVLLGLIAHVVALRTDRRLRSADDIAAACGAPVLGSVEAAVPSQGRPSLLGRLLHDNRQWAYTALPVAEDDRSREARYQRILRRIESGSRRPALLVVRADDDPVAGGAVIELAISAAAGREPVALVTEDEELTARAAAAATGGHRIVAGPTFPDAGPASILVDVRIAVARPIIPDIGPTDGALLLITMGSRTAWELAAVAGACFDAGQLVRGAVVLAPTGPSAADDRGTAGVGAASSDDAQVEPGDEAMAGTL